MEDGKKVEYFFNKLLTVNGELKAMRVDYEKKRAEAADLREQNDKFSHDVDCLREEKIELRT